MSLSKVIIQYLDNMVKKKQQHQCQRVANDEARTPRRRAVQAVLVNMTSAVFWLMSKLLKVLHGNTAGNHLCFL